MKGFRYSYVMFMALFASFGFSIVAMNGVEESFSPHRVEHDQITHQITPEQQALNDRLHLTVNRRNTEDVIQAINDGAGVNAKDDQGRSPLHVAVKNNDIESVQALIDKDANVNVQDKEGKSPLHIAVQNNNIESVQVLANAKGIDLSLKDKKEKSPLDYTEATTRDVPALRWS